MLSRKVGMAFKGKQKISDAQIGIHKPEIKEAGSLLYQQTKSRELTGEYTGFAFRFRWLPFPFSSHSRPYRNH